MSYLYSKTYHLQNISYAKLIYSSINNHRARLILRGWFYSRGSVATDSRLHDTRSGMYRSRRVNMGSLNILAQERIRGKLHKERGNSALLGSHRTRYSLSVGGRKARRGICDNNLQWLCMQQLCSPLTTTYVGQQVTRIQNFRQPHSMISLTIHKLLKLLYSIPPSFVWTEDGRPQPIGSLNVGAPPLHLPPAKVRADWRSFARIAYKYTA